MHQLANQYSRQEEFANAVSHAVGILFGLIALPFTIYKASQSADVKMGVLGVIVFGIGFLMMFVFSTLYHAFTNDRHKWIMKRLDHISIFVMIAGSYTPFILLFFRNTIGYSLLIVMWVLVLMGTVFKIYTTGKYRYLSTLIYVLMGLAVFLISDRFFPLLPSHVLYYIILGGIFYLLGVIFYLWRRLNYHHTIWHVFVLGGAICHWWAVHSSLVS